MNGREVTLTKEAFEGLYQWSRVKFADDYLELLDENDVSLEDVAGALELSVIETKYLIREKDLVLSDVVKLVGLLGGQVNILAVIPHKRRM